MPISATSPTLQIARQRFVAPPAPAVPRLAARRIPRAATTAVAVAVSWLGAGALVIGLVWIASTLSPNPSAGTPPETLPYALGWSAASLATVLASVASLFATEDRRSTLTAVAASLAAALVAAAVVANVV
ncbi:MAG: hypothetical protein ACRDMA_07930 [Solirubrobacterales bacterium]